jgi:hypothetical protein
MMGELPGRSVSDEQFANLTLRGRLTELEDVALDLGRTSLAKTSLPEQLEEAARTARNLTVHGEIRDQEGLVQVLTRFLDDMDNSGSHDTSPGAAEVEDVLSEVRTHISPADGPVR